MSIVHIADVWLLLVSLSVDGVLFKLVSIAVAVGWQLLMALMVDIMSSGMELVGSLSVFDVLFVLVLMNDACVLLVRWSGDVGLCRLVDSSVAVWW